MRTPIDLDDVPTQADEPAATSPGRVALDDVAVIAHRDKAFGPGLAALRDRLAHHDGARASWYEVDKSRAVPARVERALADGAKRIVVWGGDGTVQRAIDALGSCGSGEVSLGVMPAGTANLFARNHGIPLEHDDALAVALGTNTRLVDVGTVNGERFGVMAGTGLDSMMIAGTSKRTKNRIGKLGYVLAGTKQVRKASFDARVRVDGADWFEGRVGCVLVGNVGTLFGGLQVFEHADPTDGRFDIGVISATSLREWAKVLGKAIVSSPDASPFVTCTRGAKVEVRLSEKRPYELDGGARKEARRLKFKVRPRSIAVCVP